MNWDRIQALELEIAMLKVERDMALDQRDSARATAVRLEQELARVVEVPVWRGGAVSDYDRGRADALDDAIRVVEGQPWGYVGASMPSFKTNLLAALRALRDGGEA